MTHTLASTLASYLKTIDQLEPQSLGGRQRTLSDQDSQFLRASLMRQQRFNNAMIVVAVVLLCALFALAAFLLLLQRNSVNAVAVISGTTFSAMLGIIAFLRRLWLDKSAMDLLLFACQGLSPSEVANLVTSFYFKATEPRRAVRT
ncbi:hypothetical protein DYQ86_13570 [Acidobacteria bacterium AB60]|nr:hypothetical protein DYQ86_13570 [Acidobacteria bacterium AB60]